MPFKPRLLIIGFGQVGQRMAQLLTSELSDHPGLAGLEPRVVGIITRSSGSIIDPAGLDLAPVLEAARAGRRFPGAGEVDGLTAARELEYEVLVELSSLTIGAQGRPAVDHIKAALKRGKHAVTANKGPAAFALAELTALAGKKGGKFLFESAVMDGAPVLNLARHCLKGARIKGFAGVLNSTTNLVLGLMEEGRSLAEAVKKAQALGIAEADPAQDLEGWDAAAKTAVLANALLGGPISPWDIPRQGLDGLDQARPQRVKAAGRRLKMVCRAKVESGGIKAGVALEELAADHPFALVAGSGAILRLETDLMAPIMISQTSPDLTDTAFGVLQDLLSLAI